MSNDIYGDRRKIMRCYFGIKQRCYNSKTIAYKSYGAKGIVMCDRWAESSENFYDDMVADFKPHLEIDRIDPYGNYSPSNCRWVSKKTNINRIKRLPNKRGFKNSHYADRTKHIATKVTEQENIELEKEASKRMMNKSELFRYALRQVISKPVDNPDRQTL